MFWKKQWKKILGKDGKEQYKIPAYSKDGGHIKSLERQGGLTTSASYGGMGVRELQLRMEILIDQALSSRRSVFEPAKELAVFAKVDQDRFLNSVDSLCNTSVELAFNFCQFAPKSLQLVDEEHWNEWVNNVLTIHNENGLDASINTMKNVDNYVESLNHAPSTVTIDEVSRILESFVVGLSGRHLSIEVDEAFYTDTESIRLPEISSQFNKRADNFTLYKAMAVHQWAQTWYGTWRMNVDTLVKMYKDPNRALSLFHKLETIRLDARIKDDLPGISRAMHDLNEQYGDTDDFSALSKNWRTAIEKLKLPDTTVQDTMFFLDTVYTDKQAPADKFYQGSMNPRETQKIINARIQKEKDSLTEKLNSLQQELDENQQNNDIPNNGVINDSTSEESNGEFSVDEIDDENMPDGYKVELKYDDKAVDLTPDMQALLESILQDMGEIPDDYLNLPTTISDQNDESVNEGKNENELDLNDNVFLYDEWDHSRQKYRKEWCQLREVDIHPVQNNFVKNTLHKHQGLLKRLHRTFEALREDDKRIKRQPFGDDIDLDAVIEAYAETKMGIEASQNLFTKSRKTERNIAVMFMIDMSGSTAGWINEMEREALVLLCESLKILGDRYAIYGFSGVTHQRCDLYKVKEFDEEYNDEIKARISGIEPQDYTRMGAAIRHLTTRLHQIEARTKLLITLSDGRPDDQDGYRGPYGIEDTRRALIEAKFLGIHPFCITIDNEAMDYLQHMYGAVNFAVIDHVDKLPYKVSDIYRRITI